MECYCDVLKAEIKDLESQLQEIYDKQSKLMPLLETKRNQLCVLQEWKDNTDIKKHIINLLSDEVLPDEEEIIIDDQMHDEESII